MSEDLNNLIARLDERIERDLSHAPPRLFADLKAAQRAGITHDDRPVCTFLRPFFMARSRYERMAHAARVLSEAFERMAEAALEDETIMAELDLTGREAEMARLDPGYRRLCVSSRLDAFCAGDEFKFLEYNAETPAGVADQMQLEKASEMVPAVKEFLAAHRHWAPRPHEALLGALVAAYRDFGGRKEKPSIGIIDWKGVATESEFEVLRDYFVSQGYPAAIGDPRELDYDGEVLRVGDFAIDIFYKRIIIHEYLEKFDLDHALARAYRDGRVCMANSFRSKVAHKKAGFAVLSDERFNGLFTGEQQAMIARHIPWTRRVRDAATAYGGEKIDLLEFLRRGRARFALKPNDDYGGHGITLGWEASAAEWDAALENALRHSFIAQERAAVERVSIPTYEDRVARRELLVDFDPFLFDGRIEGGLVRLSSQSLVNVSQGGGETALVVIEDY